MLRADFRRRTVEDLLADARSRIHRRSPSEAWESRAQIIDIRETAHRSADGEVPGALWFPRNVLEWRVDPDCPYRDPAVVGLDEELLVLCDEGYQSSLAAGVLSDLGFTRAGDVVGGFRAWLAAGLPVVSSSAESPDDGRRRGGQTERSWPGSESAGRSRLAS
jgi:rhodanese-related sulfurtransferase